MSETRSRSNAEMFNWSKDISTGVQLMGKIFQNDGFTPSVEGINEFNQRYEETIDQLNAWYGEAYRKLNKNLLIKEND